MNGATRPIDPEELLANAGNLRALARRLVADDHDADDVVQQTFVAAVERPPRADVPLRPWLARVARNFALRTLRGRRRRAALEDVATPRDAPSSPAESVARTEMLRELVDAVLALEPIYRDVVIARFLDELDMPDVAARLGVPIETARTRLKRALAMLRDRLDRKYGDRRAWALLLVGRRRTSVTATAAGVLGGALMAKKLVAAGVLVALLFGGWYALRSDEDVARVAPSTSSNVATVEEAPVQRPAAAPEPIVAPSPPAPAGPRVTGRVVDATGAPVAGATIVATPFDVARTSTSESIGVTTKTGADGRFEIRPRDLASEFRLVADALDRGTGLASARAGDDVTLRLGATMSLTGRVVDLDAKPIGGAHVRWMGSAPSTRSFSTTGEGAIVIREAVADAGGAYRLDGIPAAGSAVARTVGNEFLSFVVASADGFAPLTTIWYPKGGPSHLDLHLVRGATVEGRVVDGDSGKPLADARIVVWTLERPAPVGGDGAGLFARGGYAVLGETRSDADGRFRFGNFPASGFHALSGGGIGRRGQLIGRIGAIVPGYAPGIDEIPVRGDGDVIPASIKLWPVASVTGRVVDKAGRPLAGLRVHSGSQERVRAWLPSRLDGAPPNYVVTDAEGRYRLDDVCAARAAPSTVRIHAENDAQRRGGGNSFVDVSVKVGETTGAPDLVFSITGLAVHVVVTDAGGAPIWGAYAKYGDSPGAATNATASDRDGRIEFFMPYVRDPAALRNAVLTISAPGFLTTKSPPFTPSVEAPPDVRVTLVAGRHVSGRVLRADDAPARGVLVSAATADVAGVNFTSQNSATTDDDGAFEIGELPEGPYRLRVQGDHATAVVEHVATDARDVTIAVDALPPPLPRGSLEIRVIDTASGAPVAGARASLCIGVMPSPGWFGRSLTAWAEPDAVDAPGLLRWSDLEAREWTLDLSVDGYVKMARRDVHVTPGDPTTIEVRVTRGGVLRGTATADDGVDVDELEIQFAPSTQQPDESTWGSARLRADHTYEIRGVRPGRYHPLVNPLNMGGTNYAVQGAVDVVVPAEGGDIRVDLRVVRAGTIGFMVAGEKNLNGAGRYVVRDLSGNEVAANRIVGIGAYQTVLVPPGTYDFTAEVTGREPATKRVTVAAGESKSLKF